jgi:hypothetical protein
MHAAIVAASGAFPDYFGCKVLCLHGKDSSRRGDANDDETFPGLQIILIPFWFAGRIVLRHPA